MNNTFNWGKRAQALLDTADSRDTITTLQTIADNPKYYGATNAAEAQRVLSFEAQTLPPAKQSITVSEVEFLLTAAAKGHQPSVDQIRSRKAEIMGIWNSLSGTSEQYLNSIWGL